LLALTFASFICNYIGKPVNFKDLITHVSFIHTYFPENSQTIISPAWSLVPEIQFYIILPLLASLVCRNYKTLFVISLGVLLSQILTPTNAWPLPEWWHLPQLAFPFCAGMFAALVVANKKRVPIIFFYIGLLIIIFVGGTHRHKVVLDCAMFLKQANQQRIGLDLFLFNDRGILASFAIFAVIAGLAMNSNRFFAAKSIRLLGIIGYGIFLFHAPFYHLLNYLGASSIVIFFVGIPLSIITAILSYCFIESPAIAFGTRKVSPRPLISGKLVSPAFFSSTSNSQEQKTAQNRDL
jgi:peptidoglycan/LPS O-acetylase OafA/YrhL